MNTKTTPTKRGYLLPLTILCLAFAGWDVWQQMQMNTLSNDNANLAKSLATAEKRAKDAAADAAHWHKQSTSLLDDMNQAVTAVNTPAAAASSSKRNFKPEEAAAMAKSPGLQNIIASQQSALNAMTFKDLLDRFNLSPEERDYMLKLLLDRQMVKISNGMQMMSPATTPEERAALGQNISQGVDADNAKLRDFLNSDSDYAALQSYSQQEKERTEVGMFESSLTGDNSLSPDTADQLAGLLADTRKNFSFTVDFGNEANFANPAVLNTPTINTYLDEQAQYQAQVAEKAASLLTPAQLQAFKQNQAAMRQMSKMQLSNIVQLSGGGQ
ncbi:MAG TPA: hypothetical protein VK737_02420 [Opitutales bacterium]|jgi:hypothetical protein|nr:hypothetical protein [Opitutales bacterium]